MQKPDYMSEEELKDLEEMKAEVVKKKLACFDYIEAVTRYNDTDLLHSGYRGKTTAQAIEMILKGYMKDIEKLHKAHIKKYPDD